MGAPSEPPIAKTLKGRWGLLRPLSPANDAPKLFRLANENVAEMQVGPFPDEDTFRWHLDDLVGDTARTTFAVADRNDHPLGWLCLMAAQPMHRSIELEYVMFSPPVALATEALYLIMAFVFDELGYHRLAWSCADDNQGARKAATRLGFRQEGLLRQKLVLQGKTVDVAIYSMLADEWKAARTRMKRWLATSNFHDDAQVEPLVIS